MPQIAIVITTVPDCEVGMNLIRSLVERRVIACGHLDPSGRSIYRWHGEIKEEKECALILKTSLRFKDYIAEPKTNGYQSLHTTLRDPSDQIFELQIRSRDMHSSAEQGPGSHWSYSQTSSLQASQQSSTSEFWWRRWLPAIPRHRHLGVGKSTAPSPG